jgi:UDP-N-acetylglucosamine/UDP-N-acetylgalactosamine diphosphorylase
MTEAQARELLHAHGQNHVMRWWDQLDPEQRARLLEDIRAVDFPLIERLIRTWVLQEPEIECFYAIAPVPVIPAVDPTRPDAQAALQAGEEALRAGRVGLFLVAGGQGTRLGFPGPKGAYPIGPITGKTIFEYHAEKIHNIQRRYGCVLPWYIMVSDTNDADTRQFFETHQYFGLKAADIKFFRQRMVPCVDEHGRLLLEAPHRIAMNPNGHGGAIPAMIDHGVVDDARARGVDTLSYFQVDNWAAKVADPYFIGYHVMQHAEMSSKVHRKREPHEAVGVHCLCDGEYRVIEYSELDIYPQLLETDSAGNVVYFAGNPAIHVLDVEFVERVYANYGQFPWHRAHKKIPYIAEDGACVLPEAPNGYKFETFIFDALRFIEHPPVALEIRPLGEYTPIKSFEGPNSVVAARESMNELWGGWLEAADYEVPRNGQGRVTAELEISPMFALTKDEFVEKAADVSWPGTKRLAVHDDGSYTS